ncbi:MAG: caspase family protein [Acidobacteriota bacterium]
MTPSRYAFALLLLAGAFVATAAQPSADDLLLVDCRLPPKMKRIGGRTYPMASRPIRTTAVDCRIRGGEYTTYDRANYQTSLKIWLAEAEKGNADAQYYVGKIYEGGLGTEPDYTAAAKWYEKAAASGHSPSQFELASMYEKGEGVPKDGARALTLYRSAAGLPANVVIIDSARYEALEQAANDLALREEEIESLQRELDKAKQQQKRDDAKERSLLQKLEEQKRGSDTQKKELARLQGLLRDAQSSTPAAPVKALPTPKKGSLGRFFAVVIGNGQYQHLPRVATAESDAKAMATLLRDSYGFEVTLLLNAPNAQILSTLYSLSQNLAENDNLVVFYTGHGKRDLRNRRGWWLPVDAVADDDARTNWLPNQEVSDRLALIPARHILVMADASYVGDITRGTPQPEPRSLTPAQWNKYIDTTKRKRARLALSSGADAPLPAASGSSSRFTATLLNVLRSERGVVPASRIHREVVDALTSGSGSTSVPTFAPLQSAFHDGVDFLFEHR